VCEPEREKKKEEKASGGDWGLKRKKNGLNSKHSQPSLRGGGGCNVPDLAKREKGGRDTNDFEPEQRYVRT